MQVLIRASLNYVTNLSLAVWLLNDLDKFKTNLGGRLLGGSLVKGWIRGRFSLEDSNQKGSRHGSHIVQTGPLLTIYVDSSPKSSGQKELNGADSTVTC